MKIQTYSNLPSNVDRLEGIDQSHHQTHEPTRNEEWSITGAIGAGAAGGTGSSESGPKPRPRQPAGGISG